MQKKLTFNKAVVALSVVCVATAAVWYWQSGADERIFNKHFEHVGNEVFMTLRSAEEAANGSSNQADADLQQAVQNYDAKRYEASLASFKKYFQKNPEDINAIFLAGMAALEIADTENAIHYLNVVRINAMDEYYEPSSWNLALAYLKANNELEAKFLLEEIAEQPQSAYAAKAKDVLARL